MSFDSEKIEITMDISHSQDSQAEGYPGYIHVIMPHYMQFTADDTFTTNYQVNATPSVTAQQVDGSTTRPFIGEFEFVFVGGISFTDVITLTFNVTVDPDGIRPSDFGSQQSSIILAPLCFQQISNGYPSVGTEKRKCGTPGFVQFSSVIEGIDDNISIVGCA